MPEKTRSMGCLSGMRTGASHARPARWHKVVGFPERRKMNSALELTRLATTAATRAAGWLRSIERPRDPAGWGAKGANDFVTAADRRSEEIIAHVLLGEAPGSTILGEELSPEARRSGLV